jgi:glycosyltransferase involved in cell wall biosynthesis
MEVFLLAGEWQRDIYKDLENKAIVVYVDINSGKVARAVYFIFSVHKLLKKYEIDIYHLPDTNPLPLTRKHFKIVSTIHDCAEFVVPNRFSLIQSFYRRLISRFQAIYSDLIITVSNSSKQDIVRYHGVDESKVKVIYNGVSKFKMKISENSSSSFVVNKPVKYILYVGVLEKAKNVELLAKAYAELPENLRSDVSLVFVGRKGNAYKKVAAIVEKECLHSNVVFYGYLSDEQLIDIYKNALIFAYVSEYEGFGLPILESMALGVPVLTSNKSSMKEIAEDAAMLVETNVEDIRGKMNLLITNAELRNEYVVKGFELIKKFDWGEASIKTYNVYEALVN